MLPGPSILSVKITMLDLTVTLLSASSHCKEQGKDPVLLKDDPLQACVLNLQLIQTYSKVVRMGGGSVGSCPPNVFSLVDRANTVARPGVSLVLKLKLRILMLLFMEFSASVHSKSVRTDLVTSTTDARKVCCLTLQDLMTWCIFPTSVFLEASTQHTVHYS